MQVRNKLASMSFLPVDEYIQLKSDTEKQKNADTPKVVNVVTALQEESEEASDEASTPAQNTCAYGSVSSTSKVDSEDDLPMHNIRLHLRHPICMESEESAEDDNDDGMSKDKTKDKETLTASERLDILRHKVPAHQETSKRMPGSTSQVLND